LFILDRQVLILNMRLHVGSLLHVGRLDPGGLDILPLFESCAYHVASHSVDRSGHEPLTQLELPDILSPSGDDVSQQAFVPSHVDPVTPFVDVATTPG